MDKATFDKLVTSQTNISSKEASQLEELLSSFPYCQTAHLLLAKESHDKNSMLFPQKLKRAAAYALDRKVLHGIIHKQEGRQKLENKIPEAEIQKKTAFESTVKLNNPQNFTLLKELEDNLRLLREQKNAYAPLLKEVTEEQTSEMPSPVSPIEEVEDVKLSDKNIERHIPFENRSSLFIEETQMGEELTADTSVGKSEVDLLLSYLHADKPTMSIPDLNQGEIIKKFIESDPKISRPVTFHQDKHMADLSVSSAELKIELVTENYAQILVKQDKLEKAKEIYTKLMLKYPDKSAYFAAKITELDSK